MSGAGDSDDGRLARQHVVDLPARMGISRLSVYADSEATPLGKYAQSLPASMSSLRRPAAALAQGL